VEEGQRKGGEGKRPEASALPVLDRYNTGTYKMGWQNWWWRKKIKLQPTRETVSALG
jgi:hypothetical protein